MTKRASEARAALVVLGACLALSAPSGGAPAPVERPKKVAADLVLEIEAPKSAIAGKEWGQFKAVLVNRSKNAVTLVQPGDGSDCGWRTPLIWWSAIEVNAPGQHPEKQPPFKGGRCGNVNSLTPSEVFALAPGKSKELTPWVGAPAFPGPGTYRVRFCYQNVPDQKWRGLARHDLGAMARAQASFACLLKSNEVTVTVVKGKR